MEFTRTHRGADADAAGEGIRFPDFQVVQAFQHLLGDFISPRHVFRRDVRHQHHEFVAADPAEDIAGPEAANQDLGEGFQHFVSHQVSEAVVHLLEIVDVKDQKECSRAGFFLRKIARRFVFKRELVEKPGQKVRTASVGNLGEFLGKPADVPADEEEHSNQHQHHDDHGGQDVVMNHVLEARRGLRGHQGADDGVVALLADWNHIGLAVLAVDHDMAAPNGISLFQGVRPDGFVRHQAVQAFAVLVPDRRRSGTVSKEEGYVHCRLVFQVIDDRRLLRDVEVHTPPDVAVLPPLVITVALAGVERHCRHGRRPQIAFLLVVQCGAKLRQPQKKGGRREDNQGEAIDEQELCF